MNKKRLWIIIATLVILLLAVIVGAIIFYVNMLTQVSSQSEEITVTIEKGSTSSDIGNTLYGNGLIKNKLVFDIYTKLNNVTDMKAGEYDLNKNMNVEQIVKQLQQGPDLSKTTMDITFLEGKNIKWVAQTIAEKTNRTQQDVLQVIADTSYIETLINKYWFLTSEIKDQNIYYPLEGYLFPDTYNFKKDVEVKTILETMLDRMEEKLEPYKPEIQSTNISVHKLLTVASIVELESSNPEDRAKVASVLYNRLKNNMSLGSDVTTYYAIKVNVGERDLYQSELNAYNPYNTRGPNMEGKLPIGPICLVGLKSIEAALHPEETDYLYFVADKNGKLYFAKNSEEHNSNIKKLQSQGLWYEYE